MMGTPSIWDYRITSDFDSIYNTIPSFVVYVMDRVLAWVDRQGGVEMMEEKSMVKSRIIYNVIDSSDGFYSNSVEQEFRSRTNLPMRILGGNEKLEEKFAREAKKRNMLNFKSYFGGLRVSLYNAMTIVETRKLEKFMIEFYSENRF